jgi:hypothetical protein
MPRSRLHGVATILLCVAVGCGGDSGKGKPDSTVCTAKTCSGEGKNCGSLPDGCGKVLQCGAGCTGSMSCGGGGVANVCGVGTCAPTSCATEGKTCGPISDKCSEVLQCGDCPAGKSCGSANVCVDRPDSGAPAADKGPAPDSNTSACSASCMAQLGAVCCTQCACTAAVKCKPVCDSPYLWDCELGCCTNTCK